MWRKLNHTSQASCEFRPCYFSIIKLSSNSDHKELPRLVIAPFSRPAAEITHILFVHSNFNR